MQLQMKYIKDFHRGRSPQIKDVLIDTLGIICGSGLTLLIIQIFTNKKEKQQEIKN